MEAFFRWHGQKLANLQICKLLLRNKQKTKVDGAGSHGPILPWLCPLPSDRDHRGTKLRGLEPGGREGDSTNGQGVKRTGTGHRRLHSTSVTRGAWRGAGLIQGKLLQCACLYDTDIVAPTTKHSGTVSDLTWVPIHHPLVPEQAVFIPKNNKQFSTIQSLKHLLDTHYVHSKSI